MILSDIKIAYVDFDGTLVDSENCWLEAYTLACKEKDMLPFPHIITAFDQISFEEWQRLVEEQLGNGDNTLFECGKLVYTERTPKESVMSIVRALPDNCVKLIITREPSELVWYWLKHNHITNFEDVITTGDERAFTDYYKHRGLLLIDDNYKHCKAAKAANAIVVGVNDHHTTEGKSRMRSVCDCYLEN